MDDEIYPKDPKDIPGRKFVHCRDKKDENLFKGKNKNFKKFLVAIHENGRVSDLYVANGIINGKMY
jgi:hypothetical protein